MAKKTTTTLPRFQRLFRGRETAYGQWVKDAVKTLKTAAPEEAWVRHLEGEGAFLGQVPIRLDNSCYFGAIDIDDDTIDHAALAAMIEHAKLPLVVCRSKSGGAHIYLFLKDPATATLVQSQLGKFANHLGFKRNFDNRPIEIFPKQKTLTAKDPGNWINLPYYGSDSTNRYGVRADGSQLTLIEFLDYAEATAISSMQLEAIIPGGASTFQEGPPCLQALDEIGFPEGSRNMGMYNVGVNFKLVYPDDWQAKLTEYNESGKVDPPLKDRDLEALVKSLDGHDYRYKCDDLPIVSHCQKGPCKKRRFGITAFIKKKIESQMPSMGSLRKIMTDPPRWLLRVDDEDLDLMTDDLMLVPRFRRAVLEKCNKIFPVMKQQDWDDVVSSMLLELQVILAPEDSGVAGQFRSLLSDFLARRKQSETLEDLLAGMPWQDGPRIYFRGQDFLDFLDRKKFREYPSGKIWAVLKDKYGAGHDKLNIKGGQVRVWYTVAEPEDQAEDFTPLVYSEPNF